MKTLNQIYIFTWCNGLMHTHTHTHTSMSIDMYIYNLCIYIWYILSS